ncbi:hypothetical protein LR48_Vigan06g104000 [Vigna angularis]|uniref:Uncharacterized protein n=1 Tax=Phaseolus angularis TaxID=3914 RepID=A0A0L9UT58_PHAAN|nr:hypothetical protein LR48_Vigan06g104000 [Vigna angularis]
MKRLHDNIAQRREELVIRFRDACGGAFGTTARSVCDMFAKGFWLVWRRLGEILALRSCGGVWNSRVEDVLVVVAMQDCWWFNG